MEDEATLSHKDNQEESIHIFQRKCDIKLGELVVAERKEKLAHGDSQKES
jgi:hypothetical protein